MKKRDILFLRHYLLSEGTTINRTKSAYYKAYLLSNFGIEVDHPELLTKGMVEFIAEQMHLDVPHSFYENPQNMKYFDSDELLIEQLISYITVEMEGALDESTNFNRIEVFKKALPKYIQGDELVLRQFNIIDNAKADEVLTDIMKYYCAYTRPLSLDEEAEFCYLLTENYYDNFEIKCKETVFMLVDGYELKFARFLDKKDIVKYSVAKLTDKVDFSNLDSAQKNILAKIGAMAKLAHTCPMSKKQAKYYNKLIKECKLSQQKVSNENSADRLAKVALDNGDVVEAAKIYKKNGAALERHLKMLLSRANPKQAVEILDLINDNKPLVLYQMISRLSEDDGSNRTFTFTKNHLAKSHVETDYEARWRKSNLNDATKKLLHDICLEKIDNHYSALPSLGKVYLNDSFYKIGIPSNTSATGKGLDVAPTGSRIAISSKYIRTFTYWSGIYDVDAGLSAVDANGNAEMMNFTNYHKKPFGHAVLFSGDDRSSNGAEYYDIDLEAMKELGYKYIVFNLHAFTGTFDRGNVAVGYQATNNLETRAWDPKNITFQFRVVGDSSACSTFAIDLDTNEMIVLNQMVDTFHRVMDAKEWRSFKSILSTEHLEVSMGRIIAHRGELVSTPEEADIVFDNEYQPTENQVAVRSYNIETLVSIVNDGIISLPEAKTE